jgi:hypothetical protein
MLPYRAAPGRGQGARRSARSALVSRGGGRPGDREPGPAGLGGELQLELVQGRLRLAQHRPVHDQLGEPERGRRRRAALPRPPGPARGGDPLHHAGELFPRPPALAGGTAARSHRCQLRVRGRRAGRTVPEVRGPPQATGRHPASGGTHRLAGRQARATGAGGGGRPHLQSRYLRQGQLRQGIADHDNAGVAGLRHVSGRTGLVAVPALPRCQLVTRRWNPHRRCPAASAA